jgi:uncharacterized membrane protein (DUF4010 family)
VEVAVVNRALLRPLLLPFLLMGAAALLLAGFFYLRRVRTAQREGDGGEPEVALANPFSLTSAAKFAAFFAVVLMVVALVQRHYPGQGLLVVAALAGLTDVDTITLSMADYAGGGGNASTAVRAIVIAALSNTVVKTGTVAALGSARLRRLVLLSGVLIVGTGTIVLLATAAFSSNQARYPVSQPDAAST